MFRQWSHPHFAVEPVVGGGYVSCPSMIRLRIANGDRDVYSIMRDLGDWTELPFLPLCLR